MITSASISGRERRLPAVAHRVPALGSSAATATATVTMATATTEWNGLSARQWFIMEPVVHVWFI